MARGWKDYTSGTAEAFAAQLESEGFAVLLSTVDSSTIRFSAYGLILRQTELVMTTEYRGLSKLAAHKLMELKSDSTTQTTYYAAAATAPENAVAVSVLTGTKTIVSAYRSNEGGGWKAVKTVTTYGMAGSSAWSTTVPASASSGILESYTCSTDVFSYQDGNNNTQRRTAYHPRATKRYPFQTLAQAQALVAAKTGNTMAYDSVFQIMTGTSTSATYRHVGDAEGYTVTVERSGTAMSAPNISDFISGM